MADLRRQIRLIKNPPASLSLRRPAVPGDGILEIPARHRPRLIARALKARDAGRFGAFIPASGAASRLFHSLHVFKDQGGPPGRDLRRFFNRLPGLAPGVPLEKFLRARGASLRGLIRSGDFRRLADALLGESGLALSRLPKALVPFHRDGERVVTAFEEHLRQSASLTGGEVRAHFTVSASDLPLFRTRARRLAPSLARACRARFHISFSVQDPATDTLALDDAGRPVRDGRGRIVFRPGGHGALLSNLAASGGDLLFIRNIDNAPAGRLADRAKTWRLLMAGLLLELQESSPSDRPWRVCGMIRNAGEPGGGPFWVKEKGGESLQIVESAEVHRSPGQQKILASAAYFNPVDMVVGLRDRRGRPFDLERFKDPAAVIVSKKSLDGRPIRTLEWPGLWNGGMARWNTVFVEIPPWMFHPVKTVNDLLRPGHRAR